MFGWRFGKYGDIFSVPAFRLFWSGFTFSVLGDAMSRVALTWFVYETTGSAEALGWLMLAYTGPVVLGGLVAGTLLDKFDRRKVMLVDNVVRGLAMASVPLLHYLGLLELWHIYVVAAIYGSLMMVSLAGGPSLIPSLVRKEQLATANAMEMLTFTLGGVLGPMLAGLLVSAIGAPNVLVFDALTYGVFALALSRIKLSHDTAEAEEAASGQENKPNHTLWDVTRFATRNQVLRSTTLMFAAFNLGQGFLFVWLPVLSDQMPGGGPELYGMLLGVWAVGEVIGSILAGSMALSLTLGTLICGSQLLSGLSLGILLLDQSLWYAVPALALLGLFSAPLTIWAQTLRMQVIPANMRGRTFALLRTLMQSTPPLGGAIAGLLLPLFGIPAMIAASAALAGVPGLLGYAVADLRSAGAAQPTGEHKVPVPGDIDYAIGE